jgi:tetratricopeptide (TPR) repeat protein
MRVATSFWLSGTVLALLVCTPVFEGRRATAAPLNPLRAHDSASSDAGSGSEVRFIGGLDDRFSTDIAPAFEDTSPSTQPQESAAPSDADEPLSPVPQAAGQETTMPRPDAGSPIRATAQEAAENFQLQSLPVTPAVHHDEQVTPAADYQPGPREMQPHESARPPIYHGLREQDSRYAPAPVEHIQPFPEPPESQDRLYGPGGLRMPAQSHASQQGSASGMSQRGNVVQQGQPRRRPAGVPIVAAPTEKSLRMALAGVSPSAQPIARGGLAAVPAEQLLRQAHDWAAVARTQDDYARVIDACQKANRLKPDRVAADYGQNLAAWAFNRRGQLRSQTGQQQLAMADFNEAIRLDPQCWRALHNRGVMLAIERKFEPAFDDFNRTVAINPSYAKAYSNRAALFVVAGQLDPALQDYRRAAQLDPELVTAHRGQARVCHLLGKLDESLEHYDVAVRLAPNDAYTVERRAELLTDLGRYADAAADYDRAIGLDPQLASAYRGSAWLLATCPDPSINNSDLALRRAAVAVRLEESPSAESFDALAAAQASSGDYQTAQQTIRHAIRLAPESQRVEYLRQLATYQQSQPYRLGQNQPVQQASYAR